MIADVEAPDRQLKRSWVLRYRHARDRRHYRLRLFATIGGRLQEDALRHHPCDRRLVPLTAVAALSAVSAMPNSPPGSVSGSAYTYSYATLGDRLPWIIGWTLSSNMQVGMSRSAIASGAYFHQLCGGGRREHPCLAGSGLSVLPGEAAEFGAGTEALDPSVSLRMTPDEPSCGRRDPGHLNALAAGSSLSYMALVVGVKESRPRQ